MRNLALLALLLAVPAIAADRSVLPPPTEPRPFVLPTPTEGTLANGIHVQLVESHELPFVWVTLAFSAGSADDPPGQEGLAEITMDMLNEGAGDHDALAIAAALKRLGSDLGASAGPDGGDVSIRALSRNLGPTLDLMAEVLETPTFPAAEWEILKKQYLASLQANRSDPNRIASRTFEKVLHGDSYRGREMTEASIGAIDTAGMRAWYQSHLGPEGATLLVGGDTTLATILPELEKRFGSWKAQNAAPTKLAPPVPITRSTLYVVDKPGAAQSVILAGRYVGSTSGADYSGLLVAHQAMGGQFSSRINLNLREKNGYTYGARTTVSYNRLGVRFGVSTSVKTDVTVPAMRELFTELRGPTEGHRFGDAEVADARDAITQAWPLRFENPGYLLGQLENIWRYGLPSDWVATYAGKVQAVNAAAAQAAWQARLTDGAGGLLPMSWVVVGDLAKIREGLVGLGMPVVELDVDGKKKE